MNEIDPENPVVRLCAKGIETEMSGEREEARKLYSEAWQMSADAYEACIAAHYVARVQDKPEDTLRWNRIALDKADAVQDRDISGFYPSLLLNLGKSLEDLSRFKEAAQFYRDASVKLAGMPDTPYIRYTANGIRAALARVEDSSHSADTARFDMQ